MTLRDRIVHESMKLFSQKGFLSTSITDILEVTSTSKGGFYNHFSSKQDLFFDVLAEAQHIWRQRVLYGLQEIESPKEQIKALLINYRDRYLKDSDTFPGGCIFITLSVELDDQRPGLAAEVHKGMIGFKEMLKRLLDESQQLGELHDNVNSATVTEMLFTGMLGASVIFGVDKSVATLDRSIDSLIDYLEEQKLKHKVELEGS